MTLTPSAKLVNSGSCKPTDVHTRVQEQREHESAATAMRLVMLSHAHGATPTARPPRQASLAARLRRAQP